MIAVLGREPRTPGQRVLALARDRAGVTRALGTGLREPWLATSGDDADRTFVYMRGYPSRQARDERLPEAHA